MNPPTASASSQPRRTSTSSICCKFVSPAAFNWKSLALTRGWFSSIKTLLRAEKLEPRSRVGSLLKHTTSPHYYLNLKRQDRSEKKTGNECLAGISYASKTARKYMSSRTRRQIRWRAVIRFNRRLQRQLLPIFNIFLLTHWRSLSLISSLLIFQTSLMERTKWRSVQK